ncbi:MAG TPA: Lrp/AsnC family transcriptional regulator [Myxococcota bacterium]|nr:Lrp/AsnC family transcriptional regulator [Myxococcota bacterium]
MASRPSNLLRPEGLGRALDRTDFVLLDAVQSDARVSNKELAAAADLAPSSCLERMRRLVDARVIRGFHADLDPEALGFGLRALVAVEVAHHTRDALTALAAHLRAMPEVVDLYSLAGRIDFIAHVVCRDTAHLERVTVDGFATRPEVRRIETWVVFWSQHHGLPVPAGPPLRGD